MSDDTPEPNSQNRKWAPFTRLDYPLTWYEHLKCTFCLLTITPLRLIISAVSLILVFLSFGVLFRLIWRKKTISDLTHGQFAFFSLVIRVLTRYALFLWGFYWIEDIHLEHSSSEETKNAYYYQNSGKENDGRPHEHDTTKRSVPPCVIVSNHLSLLDIFFCLNKFGAVSFLSRQALRKIPFFGTSWMQLMDCLFVKDDDPAEKKSQLIAEINERQDEYYANSSSRSPLPPPRLVVFPEGTTTNGQYLISFHRGAFDAGYPIQPIFVHHPFEHFNPSWETIPLSVYIFRLSCQFYNRVQIYHLPIYYPSAEEQQDALLYGANVREFMQDTVNNNARDNYRVELMDSTRKDKVSYHAAIVEGRFKWNELPWPNSHRGGYRQLHSGEMTPKRGV